MQRIPNESYTELAEYWAKAATVSGKVGLKTRARLETLYLGFCNLSNNHPQTDFRYPDFRFRSRGHFSHFRRHGCPYKTGRQRAGILHPKTNRTQRAAIHDLEIQVHVAGSRKGGPEEICSEGVPLGINPDDV